MRLQFRPAAEPVFTRQRMLRVGKLPAGMLLALRVKQFLRLFLEVLEIWLSGQFRET